MPVNAVRVQGESPDQADILLSSPVVIRRRFVTGRDGVETEIRSKEDLQEILAQMTDEELERFKAQYRFVAITSELRDWYSYTGTLRDLE